MACYFLIEINLRRTHHLISDENNDRPYCFRWTETIGRFAKNCTGADPVNIHIWGHPDTQELTHIHQSRHANLPNIDTLIWIYLCVYACPYIWIFRQTDRHEFIYLYINICMSIYMNMHRQTDMNLFICICLSVHTSIHCDQASHSLTNRPYV